MDFLRIRTDADHRWSLPGPPPRHPLSVAGVSAAGVAMRAAAVAAADGLLLTGHARMAALLVFGAVADAVAAWRPGAQILGPALAIAALVGLVRTARVTAGRVGAKSLAHAPPVAALLVIPATGGAAGRPGADGGVPAGAVTPLPTRRAELGILVVAFAGGGVVLLARLARIGGAEMLLGAIDLPGARRLADAGVAGIHRAAVVAIRLAEPIAARKPGAAGIAAGPLTGGRVAVGF